MSSWRGSGPSRRIADGVDAPSCITSRYVPTEKLKLLVRSSRRRKALLQLFLALSASVALMMQPSVPVMANETATAADLCYSCVRCVSLLSRARFLRFRNLFLSPRARLHRFGGTAARSCAESCSGRRTTIRAFLPPTLFDEPATAVTMRRSPSSSDQRGDLQTRRELLLPWEALKASNRPKLN